MEDKEKILGRVVEFLYDALDNFKSTMDDVTNSMNTLMNSLKKVETDLQVLGVQPAHAAPMTQTQLAARIKAGTVTSSRERLIGLLTGQLTPPARTSPISAATSSAKPTPAVTVSKPISTPGPPRAMVGPPKTMATPPAPMKIPSIKTAAPSMMTPPTVTKPPTVPPMKATAPMSVPSVMKPPTPPMAAPTPSTAAAKPTGSSIIGLRDEMLKELKRLKSIMKGG